MADSGGQRSITPWVARVNEDSRNRALRIPEHPTARGNVRALKLRYNLVCAGRPFAFAEQIELLDQLDARRSTTAPQVRLEYAILLFQNGRYLEGDGLSEISANYGVKPDISLKCPRGSVGFVLLTANR